MTHYDHKAALILVTDASNVGVSAVLIQKKDGIEKPLAFASRLLSEKNYSVTDKEGLAIIFGLNKYFQYLAGG